MNMGVTRRSPRRGVIIVVQDHIYGTAAQDVTLRTEYNILDPR